MRDRNGEVKLVDVALVMCRSGNMEDWYLIERRDHDGRTWLEPDGDGGASLMCSSRISDADIEGSALEMLAICEAIKAGGSAHFKRCAAKTLPPEDGHFGGNPGGVLLWSPRNSLVMVLVPLARALALAAEISAELSGSVVPTDVAKPSEVDATRCKTCGTGMISYALAGSDGSESILACPDCGPDESKAGA